MENEIKTKAEELMKKLESYQNSLEKEPTSSLFHYTSYEGITRILQSRRLWLTDHKYLNDPSEIEHGKHIIINSIQSHITNLNNINFLRFLLNEIIDNKYKTYIFSFCENPDYLPAWRYYGNNGSGFSVGFKKEYFTSPLNQPCPRDAMLLFQIKYSENAFSQEINRIFETAEEVLPGWHENDFNFIMPYLSSLISNLIAILPTVKNSDYKDEKEWRLCMERLYDCNLFFKYEAACSCLYSSIGSAALNSLCGIFFRSLIKTRGIKFHLDITYLPQQASV